MWWAGFICHWPIVFVLFAGDAIAVAVQSRAVARLIFVDWIYTSLAGCSAVAVVAVCRPLPVLVSRCGAGLGCWCWSRFGHRPRGRSRLGRLPWSLCWCCFRARRRLRCRCFCSGAGPRNNSRKGVRDESLLDCPNCGASTQANYRKNGGNRDGGGCACGELIVFCLSSLLRSNLGGLRIWYRHWGKHACAGQT